MSWTDNCAIDTAYIDCQSMSGGCVSPVPTWDVAYTVVDACGNSTTTHQFILMIDTVAPTIDITCPADVVVELDGDCQGELDPTQSGEVAITSTDNCDAAPTLSYTIEDTEPDYTCADGTGTYVITRTFYAVSTDHCGNTAEASCTQVLTVVDVTAPVVTLLECPADTAVALDADCAAEFGTDLLGLPTILAEDGCDIAPATFHYHVDGPSSPLCDDSDGSADGSFSFERTFYAWSVDACGNVGDTVTCVQTITALDETAPEFASFDPYEVASCEMLTDATDPTQVPLDVFDNCDADLTISIEAWPLSGVCPGSWMRIWTATDDCGNSAMAEQYISLYDDEAPVITCPNDTTLTLDMDIADDTTTVVLGLATAFDNCSSADDIDIVWSDSDFMVDCEGDDQPEGTMSSPGHSRPMISATTPPAASRSHADRRARTDGRGVRCDPALRRIRPRCDLRRVLRHGQLRHRRRVELGRGQRLQPDLCRGLHGGPHLDVCGRLRQQHRCSPDPHRL